MRQVIKKLGLILICALAALTLAILVDLYAVIVYDQLTIVQFSAVFAVLFAIITGLSFWIKKAWNVALAVFLFLFWGAVLLSPVCWDAASQNVQYRTVDTGKTELYANHRVMLFVPHQDDDILVLGGVMEEYLKYGSDVYVVFSTNGDSVELGEVRLNEAIDALGFIGIPEKNIIFLGYGGNWDPNGPHIYNAEQGVIMTSARGKTETYGLETHPAYRDGSAYTIDNFLADMESVILEYKPDILYCVDYDHHIDHRALSLSFEKVMGSILKSYGDYRPQVYKAYAYSTAWEAPWDYHNENSLATQNPFGAPYYQKPEVYRWDARIRLPIHAGLLSRSATRSGGYEVLKKYTSQGAWVHTAKVFNSDKVFWFRDTASLCYDAQILTSSGNADLLNDFMLLDTVDLRNDAHMPFDGTWVPDLQDEEKNVQVSFSQSETVDTIVLYDHPDAAANVLDAVIRFSDGSFIQTGPLDPNGAATAIPVGKTNVTSFDITLTECAGNAGLTEVEAFGTAAAPELTFVKLMDESDNFVYDYWIDPSGSQAFALFTSGDAPEAAADNYVVSCSNDVCSAAWENERIVVACPSGETCTVEVSAVDGDIRDTVYIQNPAVLNREWVMFWLQMEGELRRLCEDERIHEKMIVCRVYNRVLRLFDA